MCDSTWSKQDKVKKKWEYGLKEQVYVQYVLLVSLNSWRKNGLLTYLICYYMAAVYTVCHLYGLNGERYTLESKIVHKF